ncbi:Hypothetical protein PHPALM_37129 [Phytophthora palmivora]|uniref:Uncharacterized protein n=1 Tax=Phytophthora palmivora TaxID=4796 RepID=A0A2P4WY71_9STRA|nr:Hypothetical protein PHPALM_37129 [Phytophthora palmivora]
MRYQLLEYFTETCKTATPYDTCPRLRKELTYQQLNRVTITETGSHEMIVREPRKPKMTQWGLVARGEIFNIGDAIK